MFSCLYNLMWIQIQHHLLTIQERGGQGSFVSFSEEKETKDLAALVSSASSTMLLGLVYKLL